MNTPLRGGFLPVVGVITKWFKTLGPKARYYKGSNSKRVRSWRALQSAYDCISTKSKRYICRQVKFPRYPVEGFKPFTFRDTVLDHVRVARSEPLGTGQYGYLHIQKGKLLVLRTNNYHLALSQNFRVMDVTPPKQDHFTGLDIVEFTKWKLLRSLENFVHFITVWFVKKPTYILRLSRRIRAFATKLNFGAMMREFNSLRLFGKPKVTKLPYPLPLIRGVRVRENPAKLDQSTENTSPKPAKQVLVQEAPEAFDAFEYAMSLKFDPVEDSDSSSELSLDLPSYDSD